MENCESKGEECCFLKVCFVLYFNVILCKSIMENVNGLKEVNMCIFVFDILIVLKEYCYLSVFVNIVFVIGILEKYSFVLIFLEVGGV